MVSLKYSVGTANKFIGLNVENDTSDEEEKPYLESQPEQPTSTLLANDVVESGVNLNSSQHFEEISRKNNFQHKNRNNNNIAPSHKLKGKNGHSHTEFLPEGEKKAETAVSKGINSQEKYTRPRKPEYSQGKIRPKKEYNNQTGNENNFPPKNDKRLGKNFYKEVNHEVTKGEDKAPATSAPTEKLPDTEETSKTVESPSEPIMMDLGAWKQHQAAKRITNPSFHDSNTNHHTQGDLEAKGYKPYVKPHETKENEINIGDQNGLNEQTKKKSNNTVNLYEYMFNEKGYVELFHGHRMKGRRNPNSNKFDRSKQKTIDYKTNDAPDFKDDRAFPALGSSKIIS